MAVHTSSYRMHPPRPVRHSRGKHLIALLWIPGVVLLTALVVWHVLKEQCIALSSAQCLSVGSTDLVGNDVAVLAGLVAVGLAAIVEIAAD